MIQFRHELKYICKETELQILEKSLRYLMKRDPNTDRNGEYNIRSVYFDTISRKAYYQNEDGVDPRKKYRIRIYNHSDQRIQLEKKIKQSGMTAKEQSIIDRETCVKMLESCRQIKRNHDKTVLNDWILENDKEPLKACVLIEYVRTPYIYHTGNVRVTLDRYISASRQTDRLFNPEISKITVLPSGYNLLEVKWDDILPYSIYNILNTHHMEQTTFSKFYLGCKALGGRLINEL